MSSRKPFIAIAVTSSDYDTHYGVVQISHGEYLKLRDMRDLLQVAMKNFSELLSLNCVDVHALWFEDFPWREPLEDHEALVDGARDQGEWVPVDEDLLDLENGSTVRTSGERLSVHVSELIFTFYEKHGDHEYTSPWLSFETLRKHFEEGA